MGVFTAPPVHLTPPSGGFRQAELIFEGVEQAGPSYEARVFLNEPDAGERTPRDCEHGYAGAFHVYGYGRRQTTPARPVSGLTGGASAPITKRLRATEPIRRALAASAELTVTIVPRPTETAVICDRVTVVFDASER